MGRHSQTPFPVGPALLNVAIVVAMSLSGFVCRMRCQAELLCVDVDLQVPTEEGDQWLVFEVTDTGCGISQRGLETLFKEYVQVQRLITSRNLDI